MKKIHPDRLVSVSAIIVSVGTLFMIVYQTNLTRKAQKASVMPYLQISMSLTGGSQTIRLTNSGLGPALIEDIKIIDAEANEVVSNEGPSEFAKETVKKDSTGFAGFGQDIMLPGRLIPAESSKTLFTHSRRGVNGNFIEDYFRFPYNIEAPYIIEIVYRSVYGDKWVIRSDVQAPGEY